MKNVIDKVGKPAEFHKSVVGLLESKAQRSLAHYARGIDIGVPMEPVHLKEDVLDNLRDISASGKPGTLVFLNKQGLEVQPDEAGAVYAAFDAVKEPAARMELVRLLSMSLGSYRSISATLRDVASTLKESMLYVNGHQREVKDLGWLMKNYPIVNKFEVKLARNADDRRTDAVLVAFTEYGNFYPVCYANLAAIKDWINRPFFRGLPIAWPNGDTVTIGSPEFKMLRTTILGGEAISMVVPPDVQAQLAFDFGEPEGELQEAYVNGFQIDNFTKGYIEAMFWSSTDESDERGGEPLDRNYSVSDLSRNALKIAIGVCKRFQEENAEDLASLDDTDDYHGHNFWLTRVGHGTGFWDRGYGEVGERLTKASKVYGEADPYVGDDGKIHISDSFAYRMGLREHEGRA